MHKTCQNPVKGAKSQGNPSQNIEFKSLLLREDYKNEKPSVFLNIKEFAGFFRVFTLS